MKKQFIVEQKITAFVNKYAIYSVDEHENKGDMIAFAQQKRLAIKEQVKFYSDQSKSSEIFSFRAEKRLDIHGKFFVSDESGNQIGTFRKDFTGSLLNSTWQIIDENDKPALVVRESNQALAIIRRFAGFVPIIGEIIDLIVAFFRYHFVYYDPSGNKTVGKYQKITLFRDRYCLSMDESVYQKFDWRVLVSLSVALDALQGR